MKKIVILAIFIWPLIVFAGTPSSIQKQIDDAASIWFEQEKNLVTDKQHVDKLKQCDVSGNIYCTAALGIYYYQRKKYHIAYPYLVKAQGIHKDDKNNNISLTDDVLAVMFMNGLGVLQNDEKAADHLKTCADTGDGECAYRIFLINVQKSPLTACSWFKVAKALGAKELMYSKDNRLIGWFVNFKQISSEETIKQCDNLASQICRKIPKCIQ